MFLIVKPPNNPIINTNRLRWGLCELDTVSFDTIDEVWTNYGQQPHTTLID